MVFLSPASSSDSPSRNASRVDYAQDASDVEAREAHADAMMMAACWILHVDNAVVAYGDLTSEAIITAVTGVASEKRTDAMQVVSHQAALGMLEYLQDFIFAKDLPLGYV